MREFLPSLIRAVLLPLVSLMSIPFGLGQQIDIQQDSAVKPRHVILMIGDGLGLGNLALSAYSTKNPLTFEHFPVIGLMKTHSGSNIITDSGASATAMACGVKTYNSAVGVDIDTLPCISILELAEQQSFRTGMVVTSSLTHATPAAFVAHRPFRGMFEFIALDYLGSGLDCIIGGGQTYFDARTDQRDLKREFEELGYFVANAQRKSLNQLDRAAEKLVYFTAQFEPLPKMQGRNYFPKACEFAVDFLTREDDARMLLILEGSQIDVGAHANSMEYMLSEIEDFDLAIARMIEHIQADGETLLIVTADHATGEVNIDGGKPGRNPRASFRSRWHSADMVPVFAKGPGAERFSGVYDNTGIYTRLVELLDLQTN